MTRQQLIGDWRLSDALAKCGARRWDALPLAPKEMCRLFPSLWATAKAAGYRSPGQTSWSKALIRHEADPQTALAAVLGVAAEAIQVGDNLS